MKSFFLFFAFAQPLSSVPAAQPIASLQPAAIEAAGQQAVAPEDQVWVAGAGDRRVVLSDVAKPAEPTTRIFLSSSAAARSGVAKTKLVEASGDDQGDARQELSKYDAEIQAAAEKYRLPENLVRAVVRVESNFDPKARSHAGARGLMQLMPHVWPSLGVKDPSDPRQCVEGGAKLLREYADRYDGDLALALAAYNAGPGNVAKKGGIPFRQTGKYVADVLHHYDRYVAAQSAERLALVVR